MGTLVRQNQPVAAGSSRRQTLLVCKRPAQRASRPRHLVNRWQHCYSAAQTAFDPSSAHDVPSGCSITGMYVNSGYLIGVNRIPGVIL